MTSWSDDYIQANGIKLHYARAGNGPTIVLSHGLTDSGACWSGTAEVLSADYDVITYDARGHGLSDAPAAGYATEDRAADLAGLIAALGLDRPVLMGHSMGGATSAATAALYPALARAVILEDPPWRSGDQPNDPKLSEGWRERALKHQQLSTAQLIAECRAEHPDWPEDDLAPWADAKQHVKPQVFNWLNGMPNTWRDEARRITCPALLITGDPARGAIVTAESAQEFLSLCPSGKVAHIAGAGHNIRREQFGHYLAVVQAYLREIV